MIAFRIKKIFIMKKFKTLLLLLLTFSTVHAQNVKEADYYSYSQKSKVDNQIVFDGRSFSSGPVLAVMFPFDEKIVKDMMETYGIEAKQRSSSSYEAKDKITVNVKYNGITETHSVSKFYTERLRRTMNLDEMVLKLNKDKKYHAFYDLDIEQTLFLNRDHITLLEKDNNIEIEILYEDKKVGEASVSVLVEDIDPFDKNAFNIPEPKAGLGEDKNKELVNFVIDYRKEYQKKDNYEYLAFYLLSDDWIVYKEKDEIKYRFIYTLELKKYPSGLYGYSTTRIIQDYEGDGKYSSDYKALDGWGRFGYLPKMAADIILNRYQSVDFQK